MTVTSAKGTYKQAERVELSVELTNRTAEDCRVSTVPDGAVVIVGMTRDDAVVTPVTTEGSYPNGFSAHLAANTASLAPGGSRTIPWSSAGDAEDGHTALPVSTMDTGDVAALSFWPLDEPGKYAVSVRYVSTETGPCQATGDPVTVTFEVRGNR